MMAITSSAHINNLQYGANNTAHTLFRDANNNNQLDAGESYRYEELQAFDLNGDGRLSLAEYEYGDPFAKVFTLSDASTFTNAATSGEPVELQGNVLAPSASEFENLTFNDETFHAGLNYADTTETVNQQLENLDPESPAAQAAQARLLVRQGDFALGGHQTEGASISELGQTGDNFFRVSNFALNSTEAVDEMTDETDTTVSGIDTDADSEQMETDNPLGLPPGFAQALPVILFSIFDMLQQLTSGDQNTSTRSGFSNQARTNRITDWTPFDPNTRSNFETTVAGTPRFSLG